jgi:BMFP domain-containing protein YqiC
VESVFRAVVEKTMAQIDLQQQEEKGIQRKLILR